MLLSEQQQEDENKSALQEDSNKGEVGKMLSDGRTKKRTHSLVKAPTTKRSQLHQAFNGATATSVAALRRSGLRFTDVDDPNALRVRMPEPADIIFGRGRGFQEHPGNQRMLKIISKYKQAYKSQKRSKKREFVEAVYDEITRDGSRFLKKLEGENCWVEVSIPISLEKVSHTLRGKRKGEEDLTPDSTEADASDQLFHLQKRHRAHAVGAPTADETSSDNRPQGIVGSQLFPSSATSMGPAAIAANGDQQLLQNSMQYVFANQQFAAAAQQFQNMSSAPPQGISAFHGFPAGFLSNYGNPFMLGAAASFYGIPQMAGSNPVGAGSMFGASSFYGATPAFDAAHLELFRQQQQHLMKGSSSPITSLLPSLGGDARSIAAGETTTPPHDVLMQPQTSDNTGKATTEKPKDVEV